MAQCQIQESDSISESNSADIIDGTIIQSWSSDLAVKDSNDHEISVTIVMNYKLLDEKISEERNELYTKSIDSIINIIVPQTTLQYSYVGIWDKRRYELELQLESELVKPLKEENIVLNFIEVADVNLPEHLIKEIGE